MIFPNLSRNSAIMALATMLLTASGSHSFSQNNFGVIDADGPTEGYVLYSTYRGTSTVLIDEKGKLYNRWVDPDGYGSGGAEYINKVTGNLVRLVFGPGSNFNGGGGPAGIIREYDWKNCRGGVGTEFPDREKCIVWEYVEDNNKTRSHHDMELLENGDILVLARTLRTCDEAEAAGYTDDCPVSRGPSGYWAETIYRLRPNYKKGGGKIVAVWDIWDHLGEGPSKWDINQAPPALNYNAIDVDEDLGLIVLSSNNRNEVHVIELFDSTKTAKGSKGGKYGKGGDYLYRFGNPQQYGNFGPGDQITFFTHGVSWILPNEFGWDLKNHAKASGDDEALARVERILLFNNQVGAGFPLGESSINEVEPPRIENGKFIFPVDGIYGPDRFAWTLMSSDCQDNCNFLRSASDVTEQAVVNFSSAFLSNAQRLYDLRTRILAGDAGEIFELDRYNDLVFHYRNPLVTYNPGGTAGNPGGNTKVIEACVVNPDGPALEAPADSVNVGILPPPTNPTNFMFRAITLRKDYNGLKNMNKNTGPLKNFAGITNSEGVLCDLGRE